MIWLVHNMDTRAQPVNDDGGQIFPEHQSPILQAPRDNISRNDNPSLRLSGNWPWSELKKRKRFLRDLSCQMLRRLPSIVSGLAQLFPQCPKNSVREITSGSAGYFSSQRLSVVNAAWGQKIRLINRKMAAVTQSESVLRPFIGFCAGHQCRSLRERELCRKRRSAVDALQHRERPG